MRIGVLQSLLMVGVNEEKIVGETCNLVMADHIDSPETVTQLLFTLSLSNYRPGSVADGAPLGGESPDLLFMSRCCALIKKEPVLSPQLAPKLLWTLYALDYGQDDKELLKKLMQTMSKNYRLYGEKDVVAAFKAMAHFDIVHRSLKENLIKSAIQQGAMNWSFESLADICHSLAKLREENMTFLDVVCKRVNEFAVYTEKV